MSRLARNWNPQGGTAGSRGVLFPYCRFYVLGLNPVLLSIWKVGGS